MLFLNIHTNVCTYVHTYVLQEEQINTYKTHTRTVSGNIICANENDCTAVCQRFLISKHLRHLLCYYFYYYSYSLLFLCNCLDVDIFPLLLLLWFSRFLHTFAFLVVLTLTQIERARARTESTTKQR